MSEKTRSDFEAWAISEGWNVTRLGGTYQSGGTGIAYDAWQAAWLSSRRQALEEAAAICEEQVCSASMFASAREAEDRRNMLAWAASAIRREAEGK